MVRCSRWLRRLSACALLVPSLLLASDAAVREAAEAFRQGDLARVRAQLPATRGHLLEAYVDYWALRLNLEQTNSEAIDRFLRQHEGTAIAERLRTDWLRLLGRRGDWDAFERYARGFESEDPDIQCHRALLAARSEAATVVLPEGLWSERLSEACAQAFAVLAQAPAAAPRLAVEDTLFRLRTAAETSPLAASLALLRALPDALRPSPEAISLAHNQPERFLRQTLLGHRRDREAALYALARLARSDVAKARASWPRLQERLSPEERRYGAGVLAAASARRLESDEAVVWFAQAGRGDVLPRLHDAQLAWIARAALREGAWPEVARAIDAMSGSLQGGRRDPTWRYWRARAHAAAGEHEAARALYQAIAHEFHFYGLLAAEELGQPLPSLESLTQGAPRLNAEQAARFERMPAAQRTLKLSALNLRAEAAREWFSVVRSFGDEDSLLAAEWMRQKGIWDRSINTAERTRERHDFRLRFQTPYEREIRQAASALGLDLALVFALIRQESRFWAEAVSSAGALGLMQVMPATGQWIARQLQVSDFRPSQLLDVTVSTAFGSYYLKNALDTQEGSELRAAAAYNAGAGRARQWRHATRPLEGAIYAESIPFNETRDYVKKVLANAVWYAHLFGQGETSLKRRLGTISPKITP